MYTISVCYSFFNGLAFIYEYCGIIKEKNVIFGEEQIILIVILIFLTH
jgi:hypothetical protein